MLCAQAKKPKKFIPLVTRVGRCSASPEQQGSAGVRSRKGAEHHASITQQKHLCVIDTVCITNPNRSPKPATLMISSQK